ncbi:MAG: radical SAM protein [Patescibacteria group bacterium]
MIKNLLTLLGLYRYRKLDVALTNLCNSRCKTCDIWKIYKREPLGLKKELGVKDYRLFFRKHPWIDQITFSGGEPFIKEDFLDIVFAALEETGSLSYINLVTNGVDKERVMDNVKKILAHPRLKKLHVAVSLNGKRETHNKISGIKNGYNSARELFRELKSLGDRRLSFHYSYTISNYNRGKMRKFLEETGISANDIVICFAQKSERYNHKGKEGDFFLDKEEIKKEVRIFLDNYKARRAEDVIQLIFLKLFLKDEAIPCVAGENTFHIDPYGKINQCSLKSIVVGDVRKGLKIRNPPQNCSCATPCESYFGILRMNPLCLLRALI